MSVYYQVLTREERMGMCTAHLRDLEKQLFILELKQTELVALVNNYKNDGGNQEYEQMLDSVDRSVEDLMVRIFVVRKQLEKMSEEDLKPESTTE